ncbi:NAD(P)H-hydrate dehydratase [Derxia lacustris]|uniref:NAD(P)H-hydrate dehydratase n=1 Tax=Derxia lacustris TaxID=764842 RepID=UPI000A174F76|nr:NAD(P)H-hydrate dehydratase [Derxia lacustris]
MTPLLTLAQLRAVEAAAQALLPPRTLMTRAGRAVADAALALGAPRQLLLAGPGNNGGDALEAAALLHGAGQAVTVVLFGDAARLPPDAAGAHALCVQAGVRFAPPAELPALLTGDSCVVEGLFGIGLQRAIGGAFRDAIERVNAHAGPVLAIDIPAGIDCDSGAVVGGADGIALRASATVTMIGDKPGLHTGAGLMHAGRIRLAALGLDAEARAAATGALNAPDGFAALLAPRALDSHKGSFGDLRIVGGAAGMTGAAVLAARTGLLAGAGRVFVHTLAAAPAYDPLHPEIMWRALGNADELAALGGACVVGPGLGQSAAARAVLHGLLAGAGRLVLDADALNLIAADAALAAALAARADLADRPPAILTPHPLEAARLLGGDAASVNADRVASALRLARQHRCVAVLKGAGTVIAAPDGRWRINPTGNPGLASGGTGDVLAGLTGALLARCADSFEVACAAVWLHGRAADDLVAAGIGPVGLVAGELAPAIRAALNPR